MSIRTQAVLRCRLSACYIWPSCEGGGSKTELVGCRVTRVQSAGVGDRACVDCASAFSPGEVRRCMLTLV
jgi:hypothetical protein